jgi:hypothetical protein
MAKILATDVTVTLTPEDIDRSPDGRIGIRTFPTVQFGNGVLEYSALGIPMPAIGKFGFNQAIKRAYIEQPANGFIYHFDRANHKLRIFLGAAASITVAVANHVDLAIGASTVANHVNLAIGAPTVANHIDLAIAAGAAHHHDLVIANNASGAVVDFIGINANNGLTSNNANVYTVPGGIAANGGIADEVAPAPANMANLIHSVGAPANIANLVHSVGAPANMANLVHSVTVTGGTIAEAALAEMDATVTPAATTLYMEMVGR